MSGDFGVVLDDLGSRGVSTDRADIVAARPTRQLSVSVATLSEAAAELVQAR